MAYYIQRFWNTLIGRVSNTTFERRRSNESGIFAFLGVKFAQCFEQIVSIRAKKLGYTNLILKGQRPHFPLTYVTQKRICWSSLLHWKHRTSSLFHVVWYLLLSVVFLTIKFPFLSIFTDQHWADVWQGYLHTVLPVVLNLQWYICVSTIFNSGTVSELYRTFFWISSFNTLTKPQVILNVVWISLNVFWYSFSETIQIYMYFNVLQKDFSLVRTL